MNVPQSIFTGVWRLAGYLLCLHQDPAWKLILCTGFTLGVLPSLISPRAFYYTTVAVEVCDNTRHDAPFLRLTCLLCWCVKEFVEDHYGDQIRRLKEEHSGEYPELTAVLEECCDDEVCTHMETIWWCVFSKRC